MVSLLGNLTLSLQQLYSAPSNHLLSTLCSRQFLTVVIVLYSNLKSLHVGHRIKSAVWPNIKHFPHLTLTFHCSYLPPPFHVLSVSAKLNHLPFYKHIHTSIFCLCIHPWCSFHPPHNFSLSESHLCFKAQIRSNHFLQLAFSGPAFLLWTLTSSLAVQWSEYAPSHYYPDRQCINAFIFVCPTRAVFLPCSPSTHSACRTKKDPQVCSGQRWLLLFKYLTESTGNKTCQMECI